MTNTFKVGDLVTWTKEELIFIELCKVGVRPGFEAVVPPTGFFRVTYIFEGEVTIQSLDDKWYEDTFFPGQAEKKLQLVVDKFQDDAELISALDSIGQI
jgi:hypothetical protein